MRSSGELGLYIHIPLCAHKCDYCDFYSLAGYPADSHGRLVDQILTEGQSRLQSLGETRIGTVYIGGGTPSVLERSGLRRLLAGVSSWLDPENVREFTVEANPESLDEEFLEIIAAHGVDRVSVGVQSFREDALRSVGRPLSRAVNERALGLLEGWPGRVNIDLILGLPGGGIDAVLGDLDRLLEADPGHLSVYILTVEEGTSLARQVERRLVHLPSESAVTARWGAVRERTEAAGYHRYEISNYARPGQESIHNLGYWQLGPFLGLGPGAGSTLFSDDGSALRRDNPRDLRRYLTTESPGEFGVDEVLSSRELWIEQWMMGLRLRSGPSRDLLFERFGQSWLEAYEPLFAQWRGSGLLGEGFAPTERGRDFVDAMVRELIEYPAMPAGS